MTIRIAWDNDTGEGDLVLQSFGGLETDSGLATAILISLFTDRRADDTDELPGDADDRRGWWGDSVAEVPGDQIGSKLWLLERSKITTDSVRLARQYGEEALAWLIADGVAAAVLVETERDPDEQRINMKASVRRPKDIAGRWSFVWEGVAVGIL
jgi:phage gp46-like protein